MRKPRLLRSITVLVVFYGALGMLLFLALPPIWIRPTYESMPDFMQTADKLPGLGVTESAQWQAIMLSSWSLPVLLAWAGTFCLGLLAAWVLVRVLGVVHKRRAATGRQWKGVSLSMGDILSPALPHEPEGVNVQVEGIKLNHVEQAFANKAMGLIAARPDTFAGDGHGVGLYDHTLNLMQRVANSDNPTPLLLLAAICHDLGKLTSYKQIANEWHKIRNHSHESGRLMVMLPEYDALPEKDRETLYAAVRYEHHPDEVPVSLSYRDRALSLLDELRALDRGTVAEEKQQVLESMDAPQVLIDAFWSNLGNLPFYRRGMQRGEQTVGWRQGKRLYMNEQMLRQKMQENLDRDMTAALGRIRRAGQVHALTQNLLSKLHESGHLVTAIDHEGKRYEMPPEIALWSIMSGNKRFNGVFILDMTDTDVILPDPAPFDIEPLGPASHALERKTKITVPEAGENQAAQTRAPEPKTAKDRLTRKAASTAAPKKPAATRPAAKGGSPTKDPQNRRSRPSTPKTHRLGPDTKPRPNKQAAGAHDPSLGEAISLSSLEPGANPPPAAAEAQAPEEKPVSVSKDTKAKTSIQDDIDCSDLWD